jgi:hypothetical protein
MGAHNCSQADRKIDSIKEEQIKYITIQNSEQRVP